TDEVHRDMVLGSVAQKLRHPCCRCGRWPAHTQPRRDGLQRTRRVRIQIEVRFHARDTAPEVDVRLIPNLEVPLRNLINAEVLDQVLRECTDQTIPSLHALRRRYIRL